MPIAEDQVTLTLTRPHSFVEHIGASAGLDNPTVEDELRSMIGLALALEGDAEELAAKAETEYAEHLAAAGKERPTTEELWEQMRRIREEVADELTPG